MHCVCSGARLCLEGSEQNTARVWYFTEKLCWVCNPSVGDAHVEDMSHSTVSPQGTNITQKHPILVA